MQIRSFFAFLRTVCSWQQSLDELVWTKSMEVVGDLREISRDEQKNRSEIEEDFETSWNFERNDDTRGV